MILLEIWLEIRHRGVMSLSLTEDKTAVVVVASYGGVSRNPFHFKALVAAKLWFRLDRKRSSLLLIVKVNW